jgi:hypothetical protein
MVFFRSRAAVLEGLDPRETARVEALRAALEAVDTIPLDVLSEQGHAYLRLLTQLAACGLDAAGPPLLPTGTNP